MDEAFTLNIDYKGKNYDFTAELLVQGYTYKFKVLIQDTEVFYEPDEEGNYRVIKMPWQEIGELEKIDKELLHAIQQKIVEILKY